MNMEGHVELIFTSSIILILTRGGWSKSRGPGHLTISVVSGTLKSFKVGISQNNGKAEHLLLSKFLREEDLSRFKEET
jgi:hypothetical protein